MTVLVDQHLAQLLLDAHAGGDRQHLADLLSEPWLRCGSDGGPTFNELQRGPLIRLYGQVDPELRAVMFCRLVEGDDTPLLERAYRYPLQPEGVAMESLA